MGAASCKNPKSPPQNQQKVEPKNIIIGVFGLDDAGKTSTVKAIEGEPTNDITPTVSSTTTMVTHPFSEKNDRNAKNTNEQRVKIIDVSGAKRFRQNSWVQFYDQIHGLVFVMDASEKNRLNENQETLEELLEHDKLKDKPILILANKQDQRGAIKSELDLKRKLDLDTLKRKYKIELCTAVPQDNKNKVDESIRKGFSWLIRTIDDNYTQLNSRVTKTKNAPPNRKLNRSDSDDSDNKYSKQKNVNYPSKSSDNRSKITVEKLPSIYGNKSKTKGYSDDDDDDVNHNYSSTTNDYNKKKKVLGGTNNNDTSIKKSNTNDTKAFRAPYESFPEDTPWLSSSGLKTSKSNDTFPKMNTKSSITNDTKRRDISPLVHDTKSYTNNSLSKRYPGSDNEDDYNRQQKSTLSRFDNSSSAADRFSSTTKKTTSGDYDDYNRHTNTTSKKPYSHYDDDDDDGYLKKTSTTKTNKNYDSDDNKNYRGTSSKTGTHSKYDDDDDDYYKSTSKPATRSTYNNNYTNSKSTNRLKNSDDEDDHRWSSSKTKTPSRFDDDDYPSASSKATTRPKYDDDDDDDYLNSSKKNNYKGNIASQSRRFEKDDFFTSTGGSNTTNRFQKNTDYDS